MRMILRSLAFAVVLPLGACTSMDDVSDAVSMINPFAGSPKTLPGERRDAITEGQAVQVAKGKTVVVPAARSVSWGHAAGPAGNNPGNASLDGTAGARLWSANAGDVGAGGMSRADIRLFARPVAAGGRIFTYDPNGNVSAHSVDGGGRLWRASIRPDDTSNPATGGGVATDGARVFAASGYRTVAALDAASGAVIWSKQIANPAHGAPAIGDGKVFIVTKGNNLIALNAADGNEVWTFRGVPEPGALLSSANPAVAGNVVVVPFTSGELAALDVKTGRVVWTEALAQASRLTAVSGLADISASPVVEDGVVYATGVGSRTAAFSLKNGQKLWDQPVASGHTPAVAGNAVFVVDLNDTLYAMDRKSGETIWTAALPVVREKKRRTHWAGPVMGGGYLWLISNDGTLIAVNPSNGAIQASQASGTPSMIPPVVADGKLVVLGGNGTLSAFN